MFIYLRVVVLAIITVFTAVATFAAEPKVHLELARKTIVCSDCQVILVSVENPGEKSIELDTNFHLDAEGPWVEMQTGTGDYQTVSSMGQGSASVEPGGTTIPPRARITDFLVLALQARRQGDVPLFEFPGKYVLRVSVKFMKKQFYSEPREFEVLDKPEIDWENPATRGVLANMAQYPLPAAIQQRPMLVKSLPTESLLRETGELGLRAFEFVERPAERREQWLKSRGKASRIVADWLSLCVGREFFGLEKYDLALEEFGRMKVETMASTAMTQESQRRLKRNK